MNKARTGSHSGPSVSAEHSSVNMDGKTEAVKAEIVRLTEQVLQAVTDCDYETYVKLVSPELTCFEPPAIGNIVEGLEFHKYFFDNETMKQNKSNKFINLVNPKVRLMGDVAYIAYVKLSQFQTSDNQTMVKHNEETRIWQRIDGSWLMVHLHCSVCEGRPSVIV